MATKPKTAKLPVARKTVFCKEGSTDADTFDNMAALVTSPELAAYRVIASAERHASGLGEHIDAPAMLTRLTYEAAKVNLGDLGHAEAMLMNQATALQSLFVRLAERGMGCTDAVAFETNMRIALRAQSQSRAAIETLAAMKAPPVVIAKQANLSNGPQQINNATLAQAREHQTVQTKLMGAQPVQLLATEAAARQKEVDSMSQVAGDSCDSRGE